jgi:hypothetical protein
MVNDVRPGIGVDATGGQVIDPTANVIALVEANAKAAAALRDSDAKYQDTVVAHLKEISVLRAEHIKETRQFDSDRYDKIRSVDMANAEATASQILQAVNTNALMQERTAQTLRDQVASTAIAAESRQMAFAADMTKRLSAVELSMSEGRGKQQVADPQMEKLMVLVEQLARQQTKGSGQREGSGDAIKWLALAISMMVGLISIGLFLFVASGRAPMGESPSQPQIIYVPAAPGTLIPSPSQSQPRESR